MPLIKDNIKASNDDACNPDDGEESASNSQYAKEWKAGNNGCSSINSRKPSQGVDSALNVVSSDDDNDEDSKIDDDNVHIDDEDCSDDEDSFGEEKAEKVVSKKTLKSTSKTYNKNTEENAPPPASSAPSRSLRRSTSARGSSLMAGVGSNSATSNVVSLGGGVSNNRHRRSSVTGSAEVSNNYASGASSRLGRRSSLGVTMPSTSASSRLQRGHLSASTTSQEDEMELETTSTNTEHQTQTDRGSLSRRPFGSRFRMSRSCSQPDLVKGMVASGGSRISVQKIEEEEDEDAAAASSGYPDRTLSRRKSCDGSLPTHEDPKVASDLAETAAHKSASSGSNSRPSRRSSGLGANSSREMDSVTYHGEPNDNRRSAAIATGGGGRRNGGVVRHKSSDDPNILLPGQQHPSNSQNTSSSRRGGSSRGDDLGTATLHGTGGKSSVSRIRRTSKSGEGISSGSGSGNKADSSNRQQADGTSNTGGSRRSGAAADPLDRRAKFKRAMSTENVRRPEEYGPDGGKSSNNADTSVPAEATQLKRRGGRRQGRATSTIEQSQQSSSRHSAHDEQQDYSIKQNQVQRRRSSDDITNMCPSEQEEEDMEPDDDSFAEDMEQKHKGGSSSQQRSRNGSVSSGASTGTKSKHQRKSSSGSGSATKIMMKREGEARDLLELLHDNKTVKLKDMQDKNNRRIAHFLLYEHKMGISLVQMRKSIQQDIADDPDEALRRLPLPLYVAEPTN